MPDGDDYEFDVFLSYRRKTPVKEWVTNSFVNLFRGWLGEALGGEARLFWDIDTLDVGDAFPVVLKDALRRSRCIVPIWSPSYFQSKWCQIEWQSFRRRSEKLGLLAHGLVAPVRFYGGKTFPAEARDIQMADFSSLTSVVEGTKTWELFQNQVRDFATKVAEIALAAPPYDPGFEIVEAPLPLPPPATMRMARL